MLGPVKTLVLSAVRQHSAPVLLQRQPLFHCFLRAFSAAGKQWNEEIRVKQVRLVDENGEQMGIVSTREALGLARSRGMDLMLAAPGANPPVARVALKGTEVKRAREKEKAMKAHQRAKKMKQLRFGYRTAEHDFEVKASKLLSFLEDGRAVKITITGNSRDLWSANEGGMRQVASKVVEACSEIAIANASNLETTLNTISFVVSPTSDANRALKENSHTLAVLDTPLELETIAATQGKGAAAARAVGASLRAKATAISDRLSAGKMKSKAAERRMVQQMVLGKRNAKGNDMELAGGRAHMPDASEDEGPEYGASYRRTWVDSPDVDAYGEGTEESEYSSESEGEVDRTPTAQDFVGISDEDLLGLLKNRDIAARHRAAVAAELERRGIKSSAEQQVSPRRGKGRQQNSPHRENTSVPRHNVGARPQRNVRSPKRSPAQPNE